MQLAQLHPLRFTMFDKVFSPQIQEDPSTSTELQLRKPYRFLIHPDILIHEMTWVFFDFETTGLDSQYNRIIEIGAIKVKGGSVIDEMSSLISIEQEIPAAITRITGITKAMLQGQPKLKDVMQDFLNFMQGCLMVAHNAAFDMAFLKNESSRLGYELEWTAVCSLKLARALLPNLERKNLDSLAKHYGLSFEARHRSIGDVKVTHDVFRNMLNGEAPHLKSWRDFEPYWVK